MTIAPVGAVGVEPTQALKQLAQVSGQNIYSSQIASTEAVNSYPASHDVAAPVSNAPSGPGFVDSFVDNVYSQIDKLSSKLPTTGTDQTQVDQYKNAIAAEGDTINPLQETTLKDGKNSAVDALSKTFDHAIFMAMVNQVVSGVSDTSRTLIRQT